MPIVQFICVERRKKVLIKYIITDRDFVKCPYCGKLLNMLGGNHLRIHGKNLKDLKREFPDIPTITKTESEKRSKARINSQQKINNTYKKNGKKVGFADEELAKKSRDTTLKKHGEINYMQTEEGRNRFRGKNNAMSKENPDSVLRRQSLSEKIKGRPSKLKNKSYEEIHGEKKAEELKEEKSKKEILKFLPSFEKGKEMFNVKLVDPEYLGAHVKHTWECTKCGIQFDQIWNAIQQDYLCPKCFPRFMGDSQPEREVRDFIKSLNFDIISNSKKIISPKELDIYIPSKQLAIEYNGFYRHSEEFMSKSYHIKKTIACEKIGIRLIHIFPDEWYYKNDIVKERLKNILGVSNSQKVYARECIVKPIESKIKDKFLVDYHLQGTDIGSPVRLGAFYKDQLLAVMTFRYKNQNEKEQGLWYLNRFCSDYHFHITGIAGKLLEYFKRNYYWSKISTHADRRWSNGNLYYKLRFTFIRPTCLDYWYVNGGMKRISRQKLRKRPDEPKDIPEWILRLSEGYHRIFGCGSLKFELTK